MAVLAPLILSVNQIALASMNSAVISVVPIPRPCQFGTRLFQLATVLLIILSLIILLTNILLLLHPPLEAAFVASPLFF